MAKEDARNTRPRYFVNQHGTKCDDFGVRWQRLLSTKMLARSCPEGGKAAVSFGPDLLRLLKKKYGVPKAGWTNQTIITAIARVGGFLARKSDGSPGWQTIWRGWQRLSWMSKGATLIES